MSVHVFSRHALLTATVLALAGGGCATGILADVSTPEIRPGVAQGYLTAQEMPDSVALLPPPPVADSQALRADVEASELRKLRGTARWEQARRDSVLAFPEAAGIFECALGVPVTESGTPHLYRMLRRTRTDAAAVSDPAKDRYLRTRPFVVNGDASCTPGKEAGLAQNGSYPSGHTSIGWAWALILSEVAPTRQTPLLTRGRSYGESRVVCNVHWNSDVIEGRTMGSAVVARLHGNAEFQRDMAASKQEVQALRGTGSKPMRDCAAEASALEIAR